MEDEKIILRDMNSGEPCERREGYFKITFSEEAKSPKKT